MRGEGRGEGRLFELGQDHLENSGQIVHHIVVPDPDRAKTKGAEVVVASSVFFKAFRVLTAVDLDNQAPLTANEVDIVSINGLLADEFEAAELSTANVFPQGEFCGCRGAPQLPRSFIRF